MYRYFEAALEELEWHWGEAYAITCIGERWLAQRRDNGATLRAGSPDALRDLIIADYTAKKVPRGIPGDPGGKASES